MLLAALPLIVFHVWMIRLRGRSLGFLEGRESWCSGGRLLLNLLWYGLVIEIMAKTRPRADDLSSSVYQVPAVCVVLGQVLRYQSLIAMLLSGVAQASSVQKLKSDPISLELPEAEVRAHGLTRICRHPMLLSVFLFSLSFMLAPAAIRDQAWHGGDLIYLCDLLFWGAHCAVSLSAIILDERMMRRDPAGLYCKLLSESSVLPRVDRIFSMSVMEMQNLTLCIVWSFIAVGFLYMSPFSGFSQSGCGGWILNMYALFYCTRGLVIEQMTRPAL